MQIAFEMASGWDKVPRNEEHLITGLNLGCAEHDTEHEYRLYVTTFLGMGANVAMSNYEKVLTERAEEKAVGTEEPVAVDDPCLNVDMVQTVRTAHTTPGVTPQGFVFQRKGVRNWTECAESLKSLLKKEECQKKIECSMNGAYQPLINPETSEFYGFSEYWYSVNDVLRLGGPYNFEKLEKEAGVSDARYRKVW